MENMGSPRVVERRSPALGADRLGLSLAAEAQTGVSRSPDDALFMCLDPLLLM